MKSGDLPKSVAGIHPKKKIIQPFHVEVYSKLWLLKLYTRQAFKKIYRIMTNQLEFFDVCLGTKP